MREDEPDRRLRPRELVLKDAIIVVGSDEKISCSVRNQHEKGAELRVATEAVIPDRFLLHVPVDGATYRTVVRWRKKDRLGVQFYGNA